MNETVDEVDSLILGMLQADGRATHAAIGKAVGLSGPSVYQRVRRMERDGVIRGYTALIDPAALGQDLVAIVRVTVTPSATEQDAFEEHVLSEPRVLECHDVDGEDSYILRVRAGSPRSLRDLLADLRSVPDVTRTVTSIALGTVKDVTATAVLGPVATGPGQDRADGGKDA